MQGEVPALSVGSECLLTWEILQLLYAKQTENAYMHVLLNLADVYIT